MSHQFSNFASFVPRFSDHEICPHRTFWVDERQRHKALLDCCLRLLSSNLRKDICRPQDSGSFVQDVDGFQLKHHIPREVKYACLYWIGHLQKSDVQLHDHDEAHQFLRVHLLHWFEDLAWLGKASERILAMPR